MKQVGVTVYEASEKGLPKLKFAISFGGKVHSEGDIVQSKVFELNDGDALILMPIEGVQE